MARRPQGTGSIIEISGVYYGKWYQGDRQIKRRIGPVRRPGTREGLTKGMAEARLRELMLTDMPPPVHERLTIKEVGSYFTAHLTALGRKKSTTQNYESLLRNHLVPYFKTSVANISTEDITMFAAHLRRKGLKMQTVRHYLVETYSVFAFAMKRGWITENPLDEFELPKQQVNHDVRFLSREELDAVLRHAPPDERVLYLTAAMTGLRQGELVGLRWMDVDWVAQKIRVRQNYVRGEFSTPKSELSSRSVPMADTVAAQLELLFQRSQFQADTDLVFGHPVTGDPLEATKLRRRFKKALKRAGVHEVRFHDLRHTFGTHMAMSGKVSLRQLQEWMGHADIKTTMVYSHYMPGAGEASVIEDVFGKTDRVADPDPDSTPAEIGSPAPGVG